MKARFKLKNVIILVVSLGLAFGVTAPKLYKMSQIRGWVPGATSRQETITQKWHQTSAEHPRGRDTYWIAWSDVEIRTVGDHRLNVEGDMWDGFEVGDQIDVVRLPGDRWPYTRDGIFASAGNIAFDCILLLAEIGVAVTMVIGLFRDRTNTMQAE